MKTIKKSWSSWKEIIFGYWCVDERIILIWILGKYVGFEVLTVVVMKSTIFWDITPCSPLKVNWRFGETHCLQLQGRILSQARNQGESLAPAFTLVSCSAYSLTLKMEAMFPQNVDWLSTLCTALHSRRQFSLGK
jgi:hypothetical protein